LGSDVNPGVMWIAILKSLSSENSLHLSASYCIWVQNSAVGSNFFSSCFALIVDV